MSSAAGGNAASSFECNICFELAQDPVVTLCGHLFCWPCLYRWLHGHSRSSECPVCKALVAEDKLVPLYGRGKTPSSDPRHKSVPSRPAGPRPATAPPPPQNNNNNPSNARFGNFTFSAGIGGIFPFLSFHMHGFPDAYGFPFGYPNGGFYGAAAPPPAPPPTQQPARQEQQEDNFLKVLFFLVGILVVFSFIIF